MRLSLAPGLLCPPHSVRSRYSLRLQTATSPPRSAVSVYPDCSHTPPPFHVHIYYYTHLLVLYLYRFACVLWITPHVYKSRLSVLGINHLVSVLAIPHLILARSSTHKSHTADLRLLPAFVSALLSNSIRILLLPPPPPSTSLHSVRRSLE